MLDRIRETANALWAAFGRLQDSLAASAEGIRVGAREMLLSAGFIESEQQVVALSVLIGAGAVGAMLVTLMFVGRGTSRRTGMPLSHLTRRPKRTGYLFLLVLILVFGGWSVLVPLSSAALAPGIVSPDGNRKSVEHLEGGIIRQVHVKDGDHVASGQLLFTLSDLQARARYAELQEQYLHMIAIEARLLVERAGADTVTFPKELTEADSDSALRAMAAQQSLLDSRRATQSGREDVLAQRVNQIEEQNSGLVEVISALQRQIGYFEEELAEVQTLFDQGLVRHAQLLALQRAKSATEAEVASHRAKIAENLQRIGETNIQLLTMREQMVERTNDELTDTQRQIEELRSQMPSRADVLERTLVRAPISGTVLNIRPSTAMTVIKPGETLLEIVPDDAALIVDAKVKPTDIDRVHPGMRARVVLTAYRQRTLPLIHGVLRSISADRLVEDRTGQPYFLAKVEVTASDLDKLDNVKLVPGMPADVMFLNDERTLIGYLFDPFVQSVNRSFRE